MKTHFALAMICITGFVSVLGLSVRQTPKKINAKEGENVSINCYIEAESRSSRIIVKWFKNNLTVNITTFNTSMHQLSYSGNVSVNASLDLHSVNPNHSGIYHCSVSKDIPVLEIASGKGTHVYIGAGSHDTTPNSISNPANHSEYTGMKSSLSGLGIVLLILVIFISYKRHCRSTLPAKEALVDKFGSQNSVSYEAVYTSVVYTAFQKPVNKQEMRSCTHNSELC